MSDAAEEISPDDDARFAPEAQSGRLRIDRERECAETLDRGPDPAADDDEDALHVTPLVPGTIIAGRYMVDAPLGVGGHGAVHRAVHLALDLPVAVKVLGLGALSAPVQHHLTQRFAREARTIARIRHRNVLAVHDTGVLPDGSPYLVTELIEGEDLEQRIARAPLSIPAVVDIGRQLFAALTAIAQAGVLHRDVKPANVMLRRESDERMLLKLIDFGIARGPDEGPRLTVSGQILGTPHYMAPEQLRGERLDVRADLYAACAVLYEALTGRPPHDGATAPVVIGKILGAVLVPIRELRPDCPAALSLLVEQGLAKKRADRPASALAMVTQLDTITHQLGIPTGALAWTDDQSFWATTPLAFAGRRKTPPDGAPRPPEEEPDPLEPEGEAPPVPEVPGHIQDPPPEHTAKRRARAIGAALVLTLSVALGLSLARRSEAAVAPLVVDVASVAARSEARAPELELPAPVEDVTPLLERGLEALARGEVEAALATYREACAVDPERPEAHRGRGLSAARAGLDDEAIRAYERYLSLAPDAPDADRVRSRLSALRTRRSESTGLPR